MAHFAEISADDRVLRVLVVPDEQEHRGQAFLADDIGLGGEWIQGSFSGKIRGKFPGIGDMIDRENDIFVSPPDPEIELEISPES